MYGVQPRILQPLADFFFVVVHGKGWLVLMICLNKDNEKYPYSSKLSKQKNAPFRGKFQGRLKMREIGLVADDLDIGAAIEGRFTHFTPLRDAYFGEAGATIESTFRNLRHRLRDDDAREAGASTESTFRNLRHRWGDGDAREAGATTESTVPHLRHRWGDSDAREAGAMRECPVPNLRHRWGDDGVLTSSY